MVKDINQSPSEINSVPLGFVEVNGTIFFSAFDGIHGRELWKTDGTEAGTALVKDIRPGPEDSIDYLLSNANDDQSLIGRFANVIGTFYFVANDGIHGTELWKSDGTEAGTVLVKDIDQTSSSSLNYGPDELIDYHGTLYFYADNGLHGRELWKSDGTESGTVMVKDINPGLTGSVNNSATSSGLRIFKDKLIFTANNGTFVNGDELWISDGTSDGTLMLKDLTGNFHGSNPHEFEILGETLYFLATTNAMNVGEELWKTDGTSVGTVPVRRTFQGSSNAILFELTAVGNTLFFAADSGNLGSELWKSDGTEAGTVLVKDIQPGIFGSIIDLDDSFQAVNGTLIFSADDGVHGREIWKSDGTAAGTVMVKDISDGAFFFYVRGSMAVGDKYYFIGSTNPDGPRLWRTDGTPQGTVKLLDGPPLDATVFIEAALGMSNINGVLYFGALDRSDISLGYELWRFDTELVEPPENRAPILNPNGKPILDAVHNGDCSLDNPGTLVSQIIARMAPEGGISDPDAGALRGIAINGLSHTSDGTWQFTINNGTTWAPIGTTGNTDARLLAADSNTRIRFVPNPGFTGIAKFSFVAWDRSTGTNGGIANVSSRGGSTPYSSDFEYTELSILPCNPLPNAVAIFRAGKFYLDANNNRTWNNTSGGDQLFAFGSAGDTPLVGDWNGDGITDIGVWRAGKFYLDANANHIWNNTSGGDALISFGATTDLPIAGDWNGDGITDIGTFRAGKFYLDANGNRKWDGTGAGDQLLNFGIAGDLPVIGDWNGDGKSDIGIYRAGRFYLDANGNRAWNNLAGGDTYFNFGTTGDKPIAGDWNGDGKSDVGIVRAGNFYLDANGNRAWNNTSGGDALFTFGSATDTPLVGRWTLPAPAPFSASLASSLTPTLPVNTPTVNTQTVRQPEQPSASLLALPPKRKNLCGDEHLLDQLFTSPLQLT